MSSTQIDRITGLKSDVALKAPCRAATTANISTFAGLQTVDGITLIAGDRVLVKDNTSTTENGIYRVGLYSPYTWERDSDFSGARDTVQGTTVRVYAGGVNAASWWECTSANPIRIGTDAITWQLVTIPAASIGEYLLGTSVSSLAVGTGSKSFTTQASRAWGVGTRLRAASDDSTKIMDGEVTSYSGTTLIIDVDFTDGSGTHADWNISVAGARGSSGADGTVDITTLAAETDPAIDDLLLIYDTSETANNKMTTANFMKVITDLTAETAVDAADELPIYDTSASTADKATVANFFKSITTLTDTAIASGDELLFADVSDSNNAKKGNVSDIVALVGNTSSFAAETAPAIDDLFRIYDTSEAAENSMAFADMFKVINGLTADAAPDGSTDYVVTYDDSAAAPKKVLLNALPGSVSAASQADQETGTSTTTYVSPGRQHNHLSAAKFVCYASQSTTTPTLQLGYNVTSITDTGIGQLTITIATDFSNTNVWCGLCSIFSDEIPSATEPGFALFGIKAAGSCRLDFYGSDLSRQDPESGWHAAGWGDQ